VPAFRQLCTGVPRCTQSDTENEMGKMIWGLVVALLIAGAFSPIVQLATFLVALGVSVVIEKCRNELESGSLWR
jgi:hypothetical protein